MTILYVVYTIYHGRAKKPCIFHFSRSVEPILKAKKRNHVPLCDSNNLKNGGPDRDRTGDLLRDRQAC